MEVQAAKTDKLQFQSESHLVIITSWATLEELTPLWNELRVRSAKDMPPSWWLWREMCELISLCSGFAEFINSLTDLIGTGAPKVLMEGGHTQSQLFADQ